MKVQGAIAMHSDVHSTSMVNVIACIAYLFQVFQTFKVGVPQISLSRLVGETGPKCTDLSWTEKSYLAPCKPI
jgi:hypothetical protein